MSNELEEEGKRAHEVIFHKLVFKVDFVLIWVKGNCLFVGCGSRFGASLTDICLCLFSALGVYIELRKLKR